MTVSFRPARRERLPLLVGVAGGTGSGKTFTALTIAQGIAAETGAKIAGIDTENRRMLHYADRFSFDHAELRAPFRPDTYADAIETADKAGYGVIVVDSMSHEWAGDGGILDWQEELMRGDESRRLMSWIQPKGAHRKMVTRLLGVKAHVILCFRAEQKVEMVKGSKGWEIVPKKALTGLDGWIPISEKNLPFELTLSLLFTADAPGVPKPIKLEEQHRRLVPLDRPVTADTGKGLAEWAAGGSSATPASTDAVPSSPADERTHEEILDELDGVLQRLVAGGKVTLSQIWGNVAKQRGIDKAAMRDLLDEGSGEWLWAPLRDSLEAAEARVVLERLTKLEAKP